MFGRLFSNGNGKETPSNYGDDSFTDVQVKKAGLLDDLKALGPDIGKDAMTLIEKIMSKGEPYDDRTFLVSLSVLPKPDQILTLSTFKMERIIVLTASLPPNSKVREKLSQQLVGTLWDSLQHPPLSYYGDTHQYRTADGSYNVGSALHSVTHGLIRWSRASCFRTLGRRECLTPRVVAL